MLSDDTREKLENIVRGVILKGEEDSCTAARNHLCAGFRTSTTVKEDFEGKSIIKEKQAGFLRELATEKGWWVKDLPDESAFLARGGEAMVYLDQGSRSVIKLNDGIYYATWLEFFNSLVVHNLLFEKTAYTFLGFNEENEILQAVLQQPFVTSDAHVDLTDVRKLLGFNGFVNTRRNDYFNDKLGLILEDIHDENVIVNSNTLFFIDTVFYTVAPAEYVKNI